MSAAAHKGSFGSYQSSDIKVGCPLPPARLEDRGHPSPSLSSSPRLRPLRLRAWARVNLLHIPGLVNRLLYPALVALENPFSVED